MKRLSIKKGSNNSQYGSKVCINLETKEKKRFKDIPEGWIHILEYNELNKKNSRRWYNDGSNEFYIYSNDIKISELKLNRGRLKQRKH